MNCENEIISLKKIIKKLVEKVSNLESKLSLLETEKPIIKSDKKQWDSKVILESKNGFIHIKGNSYNIKDFIKANKGIWNMEKKQWEIKESDNILNNIIACLKENDINFENNIKTNKKIKKPKKLSIKEPISNCLLDSDDD